MLPSGRVRVAGSSRSPFGHLVSTRIAVPPRILRSHKAIQICNVMGGRQDKGKKLNPASIELRSTQRPLGEGSFGTCFEGTLSLGGDSTKPVVLKRVKLNVNGAQRIQEMEHVLNVYVNRACKATSVAPFLGYLEVDDSNASGKLTPGLWLVWDYEGDKTLAYYLKRRDCMKRLMEDLGLSSEEDVVPTVMKQVFESLNDLHSAGLVHRDVKPANIVFSEEQKRFKIIDLGAAAALRTGTNYSPQETMLDPVYCAPEEYVLPTDSPDMVKQGAMAFVMSPIMWSQHRPECFDAYSAGVVMLQLSLPFLRSSSSIKNWKQTMIRLKHDIKEWREKAKLSSRQTALLDANDGAGWDLVEALLQPREIEGDGRGGVRFVDRRGKAPRMTPVEALKHPFIQNKQASARVSRDEEGGSSESIQRKKKGFDWLKSRVFDLEARIAQQASDAETQTTIVKKIEKDVAKGKATELDLEIERSRLEAMRSTLRASVTEMGSLFDSAKGFFSGSGSSVEKQVIKDDVVIDVVEQEEVSTSTTSNSSTTGGDVQFFANAASSAIYSGLKFTGRALIAVADLASSAEESLSEAQAKREAIRKEKAILQELLSRMELNSDSTWDDVKGNVLSILEDSILSESQMRRTFNLYVSGMAREERMRVKQAKLDFGTLLMDARLKSSSTYDSLSTNFGKDPRFLQLDDEIRRSLFDAHMVSVQKREATLSLAKDVLDIKEDPVASSAETLQRLRAEQERMKSEYEVMEKKLKKMESLLKTTNLLGIDRDEESVTFKFNKDKIPTAKKSAKSKKR